MAQCYEFAEKQKDALQTYERSVQLCEMDDDKVSCVIRIANCIGKLQGTANPIEYLLREIKNHPSYGKSEDMFKSLANHAKKLGDDYLYVVFCEQLLTVNPVNTEFRFSLAYKYSETGQEKLAVYHYRKYLAITNDPMALNNVAVEYNSLGLKAKAVESYKESGEVKRYKIREVKIIGDFKNLAGKYSLRVTETEESEGAKPGEVFNATGLFVINQDLSGLDVLQEVKENQSLLSWPLRS